jgi:hypothetical protein
VLTLTSPSLLLLQQPVLHHYTLCSTISLHHNVLSRTHTHSGIVILFCAALGDAFSGPSAALLTAEVPEVQPIILSVWRFTITGLIFLPFFLLQLVQGDAIAKQVRVCC